jgi:hypothetical protein
MRTTWLVIVAAACSGGGGGGDKAPEGDADADSDTDSDTDSDGDTDGDGDTDADTDADADGDTEVSADTNYVGPDRVAAVVESTTGDGSQAASIVLYDLDTRTLLTVDAEVRADTLLDCSGESILAMESNLDNAVQDRVLRIAPEDGTVAAEWEIGTLQRPRDAMWLGGYYWLALYGKPRITTWTEDGVGGASITLNDYADSDGLPEAVGLVTIDGVVQAVLVNTTQGTDTYNGAKLVSIDPGTATVINSLALAGYNPSGQMVAANGSLFIHHAPTVTSGVDNADGGMETVDMASYTSAGLTIDFSADARTQTAAYLDFGGIDAWFGYSDAENFSQMGRWSTAGSAMQSWPMSVRPAAVSYLDETVWLAENPQDGSSPALKARSGDDGSELLAVEVAGVIHDMVVCHGMAVPADTGADSGVTQ